MAGDDPRTLPVGLPTDPLIALAGPYSSNTRWFGSAWFVSHQQLNASSRVCYPAVDCQ
ncbi:hypothetical protein [Actinophytocola sp.]|uniref:hypothetical protein n=1 Tax=Actinophytocola sp. TaxID=1872138 RepID=UPI002ED5B5D7